MWIQPSVTPSTGSSRRGSGLTTRPEVDGAVEDPTGARTRQDRSHAEGWVGEGYGSAKAGSAKGRTVEAAARAKGRTSKAAKAKGGTSKAAKAKGRTSKAAKAKGRTVEDSEGQQDGPRPQGDYPGTSRFSLPDDSLERSLRAEGCQWVAGLDEVGRGAWAGPVSVGVALTPVGMPCPEGLRDSKQVPEEDRETMFPLVAEWCRRLVGRPRWSRRM